MCSWWDGARRKGEGRGGKLKKNEGEGEGKKQRGDIVLSPVYLQRVLSPFVSYLGEKRERKGKSSFENGLIFPFAPSLVVDGGRLGKRDGFLPLLLFSGAQVRFPSSQVIMR